MARIVIALGGNALGDDAKEQQRRIDEAAPALVGLIKQGHEIIVSHGNGPQVGMIQLAFHEASAKNSKIPSMDLPECTAMSQGYIGFHLQKGIKKELLEEGMPWHAATVVTQVEVDAGDPAFNHPTKPIGAFYSQMEAERLKKEHPDWVIAEDAGRGWRRMVPSPVPTGIVERDSILNLLDHEFIVIACGGGGIPVVRQPGGDYKQVTAVIDKDFASAALAEAVSADDLFILTAVDRVAINWGKPDQQEIESMTVSEAERYCEQGHFAKGSMLPKVQAAIRFAKSAPGRRAVIASLEKAPLAMQGKSGTSIKQ